jgi:hypothetical protein
MRASWSSLKFASIQTRVPAQPPRQHAGRDIEDFLELVETRQPVQGVAQDQNAPPFTDPPQATSDRTLHIAETGAFHGAASW